MTETTENGEEMRGYLVRGRVQGVGFRWWTRTLGEELELRGHVRNLVSGDVEVHAAGRAAAMDRLEAALREGPPMAHVTELREIEVGALPRSGFHIEMR